MSRPGRSVSRVAALAIVALACTGLFAQTPLRRPRLVVLLMVDQMRADYVDKFRPQWSGGLRRLLNDGAWFRRVEYPYFNTVTCAGHATVSTGSLPSIHGMVRNGWWDRTRHEDSACTEDAAVSPVSYGKPIAGPGDSAAPLRTSTLSDELRSQLSPASRAVAFSLKARAAINLAGHRPDAVAWFDDSGNWTTSTAFSKEPVPVVADFIRQHPVEADFGKVWDRLLPRAAYLFEDPAIGVVPPKGMTAGFPHAVRGNSATPDKTFYDLWQSSPFADEYLARMAIDTADRLRLGRSDTTDFIGISFSALDKVGHDYGPNSHEIQDVLARLDRTIAMLLENLDRMVGPGNYTVALTADHGVAPLPERTVAEGLPAGRVSEETLKQVIEGAMQQALGAQARVEVIQNSDVYLEAGVYDQLLEQPAALAAVRTALLAVPGVDAMFTRDQVMAGLQDGNPLLQRLARSFDRERSGDLFIVFAPYWIEGKTGTSHGSPYDFDSHVPLLLMGKGIVPGEYLMPASPTDVAPTLAFLAGVTLPRPQGRVLVEALTSPSATTPTTH